MSIYQSLLAAWQHQAVFVNNIDFSLMKNLCECDECKRSKFSLWLPIWKSFQKSVQKVSKSRRINQNNIRNVWSMATNSKPLITQKLGTLNPCLGLNCKEQSWPRIFKWQSLEGLHQHRHGSRWYRWRYLIWRPNYHWQNRCWISFHLFFCSELWLSWK